MYYPIGWPVNLINGNHDEDVFSVATNSDRSLLCLLSDTTVSLWYTRPSLMIVNHQRNEESIKKLGKNVQCVWRSDSTAIVVQTTNHFLLFYKVGIKNPNDTLLEQKDVNVAGLRRESAELFITEKIPALYLYLSFSVEMTCGISCIMAAEEEVVIGTNSSSIIGVNWDGSIDESFNWKLNTPQLVLSSDLVEFNVVDLKFSSMIGGFSMVFSSGRAAFMPLQPTTSSHRSHPSTPDSPAPPMFNSTLSFVADVDNAVATAINHRYQLIAFGLRNSEGLLCSLDEHHSQVTATHRLVLSQSTFPDANLTAGAMTILQWTPDFKALATAWERGGFALWSVFGAMIVCSLSWDFGLLDMKSNPFKVLSLAWDKEGYNLWLATKAKSQPNNGHPVSDGVLKMMIAKSVLASNPSCVCSEQLVLLTAEDRLFVGVGAVHVGHQLFSSTKSCSGDDCDDDDEVLHPSHVTSGEMHWEQQAVGNHQWIVIPMPQSYLSTNWPIRYASIDSRGQHVAIAGHSGMAHYSLVHRKWKLFGNETQEKDFEVVGGLLWWDEFVVLSCYNEIDDRYEIRAYPHRNKLDNQFVRVAKVHDQVLLMSMFADRLLTFLVDGSFHLFEFYQKSTANQQTLHITHSHRIVINNLTVTPESVTSLVLTNLHLEARRTTKSESNSILMNVCGRLFLLEKESNEKLDQSKAHDSKTLVYKGVSILATGVENIWVSNLTKSSDRPHLTESLWLSCGSKGMGVWLPLLPDRGQQKKQKSPDDGKRIMLPISTQIYPLAVLFRDAVVFGAENDTIYFGKNLPISMPFSVISRTSQVYLHHILRELLRRDLGYHSRQIAKSCVSLPYFPHSLELLLHEVLEEEATATQPIPDPLLPRIIEFIREFPVFLQTVVHCARKTELALWPHLFQVVGNPKELFQKSIVEGQLETAASYIIILQNLERTSVSRQYATVLLEAALTAGRWQLAKDLQRFLRAIDPVDMQTPPTTATVASGPANLFPVRYLMSPSMLGSFEFPHFGKKHSTHIKQRRKRTQSTTSQQPRQTTSEKHPISIKPQLTRRNSM